MIDNNKNDSLEPATTSILSRREFLRIAGIAGAAIGVGGALSGALAACGESAETTLTTGAAGSTTSTTAISGTTASTTVSTSVETGRAVKLGFVAPLTGPLAAFGTSDRYLVDHFKEAVVGGVLMGDGKLHPIDIAVEDSQSETNRAAQVAGDLIMNTKVDLMMAASTGDTVLPVAEQAEAGNTPCITTDCPWQVWWSGRGATLENPFKWTYHAFWGQDDNFGIYFDMWSQLSTNKVVGVLWPNDIDGNNYRKLWPEPMTAAGYTISDGGSFSLGNEDYTSVIDRFKKDGAEIVTGIMTPPDFTNFWAQARQQNYTPKICGVGRALNFPETVSALSASASGLVTTCWWHPTYPFKSDLTGETCQEFADNYEKATDRQWTAPLLHFLVFEWAVDVLKRTPDLDDKNAMVEAIKTTKMENTIYGPIDFTEQTGASRLKPVPNAVRTPICGAQWRKSESGKWPYQLVVCSNANWDMIPVGSKLEPIPEA